MGYSLRNNQRLWKQYREGGLNALLVYPYKGLPCRLSKPQREELNDFLARDHVQFLHETKQCIEQHFGICYSTSAIHYLFARLHIKKKTGRPSNYRKDKKGADVFKKILSTW